MRQFILASDKAYTVAADIESLNPGEIGVFYNKGGAKVLSTTGDEFKGEAELVLGRSDADGGNLVLPLYPNHFTFVKGEYQASTQFSATITVPNGNRIGDYTLIVAKKGTLFNERNKWTAEYHNTDVTLTAAELAKKLADKINLNTVGSGVKAEAAAAVITITAKSKGEDYSIIPADILTGTEVTVVTPGTPTYGDANYIVDLANKAAADAGFEYTYKDSYTYLYPKFPINPLATPDKEDTGFTIFTLRFAEPRQVKTRDEIVHQIVQVAFPTGSQGIAGFEAVCKGMAGVE